MPNRNSETESWGKEKKIAFMALPGKGDHGRLIASRLCPPLGRTVGSFTVKKEDKQAFRQESGLGQTRTLLYLGVSLVIKVGRGKKGHR